MVVSPSDKVELFLNGKSIGMGEKSYNFLHTFKNVKYEAGELKAVSYSDLSAAPKFSKEESKSLKRKNVSLNTSKGKSPLQGVGGRSAIGCADDRRRINRD